MAVEIEIRRLRRDDDRGGFSCGQPDLDRFFQHYAGQNQFKLHLGVTYVATVGDVIVGFATVSPASLERRSLPASQLQRRLPEYPLPALRLARLAVDSRAQVIGVGGLLLRHGLKLALDQRDQFGCVGVVIDAKPDVVSFYEGYGFVPLTGVREGALHGDPTAMFLSIATIAQALGG